MLLSWDLTVRASVSIKSAIGQVGLLPWTTRYLPARSKGLRLVTRSRGPARPGSTRSETSAQSSDGSGRGGGPIAGLRPSRLPRTGAVRSLTGALIKRFYFLIVSLFDGWQMPALSKYKQIRSERLKAETSRCREHRTAPLLLPATGFAGRNGFPSPFCFLLKVGFAKEVWQWGGGLLMRSPLTSAALVGSSSLGWKVCPRGRREQNQGPRTALCPQGPRRRGVRN